MSQQRWIPVSERLPENGSHVIAFIPKGGFCDHGKVTQLFYNSDSAMGDWSDDRGHYDCVTHWMPLPEPPEVE